MSIHVPTMKNGPAEVQLDEANTTETKGSAMNKTIVTPTPEVAKLLDAIDNTPAGHIQILQPGEPWYQEPTEVWIRPVSELRPAAVERIREALAAGGGYFQAVFANYYDFSGRRLGWDDMPEGWWEPNLALNDYPDLSVYTRTPNSVGRFGAEYLVVGRGHYLAVAETTVDGEAAFEFVTSDEVHRRANQAAKDQTRAYLDAHPAIEAAKPAWADRIRIYDPEGDEGALGAYVDYSVDLDDLGDIYLLQEARYADGVVKMITTKPELSVDNRRGDYSATRAAAERLVRALDTIMAGS